jgi:hypothetical protein
MNIMAGKSERIGGAPIRGERIRSVPIKGERIGHDK